MNVAPKVMSCEGTIMFWVTFPFDPRRIVSCEGFVISQPFLWLSADDKFS
jgi:hypothetical protein